MNQEPELLETAAKHLRRPSLMVLVLGLSTLVLYSGALFFDFVWDDWPQIVNSPIVRSWHNVPRAFGTDLWYHVARHQVYYRPLFVVWSILNYSLFRLRPFGWHFAAILAHVAAVATVFWLARKLRLEYWTAAVAALIFALHPVHIEPVVWISAASDTMVTVFVALAFIFFLEARERSHKTGWIWTIASCGLLACALLTKEMAITFFVLVAIYAWLQPKIQSADFVARTVGATREAVPYVIVTVAYMLLRKHALLHSAGQFDPGHGAFAVLRTLPRVLTFYLQKLVWPSGLTGIYYMTYVETINVKQVILPVLGLAAAVAGLWYWNRREGNSTVAFAGWWFLIGLAPALYLRNFGNGDLVRDRYVYLPSIGFAILAAIALRHLPAIGSWSGRAVQACAVLLLCSVYVLASLPQQVYWASDLLLLDRGHKLYPENPFTTAWLASEFSRRGANDHAIELAREAAIKHPEYPYGALSLAEAYIRAGHFDEGKLWLQKVSPEYTQSETGMAAFAGLYGRMGDFKKAFALCSDVLAKEPDLYSANYNCGNVHLMDAQYREAETLLTRAVSLAPDEPGPRHYLGRALLEDGRTQDAEAYLRQAAAMDPKVWDYHYWLGISLQKRGDLAAARREYEHALGLNPESAEAKARLAALETK